MESTVFSGKRFFPLLLCALVLSLAACSMQKSGSKVDASHTGKQDKPSQVVTTDESSQEKMLKVDYLTPISAIRNPEVFVYKEKRRLYIVDSNVLVRDYPIGLGFHPRGDKEKEGDGRTPEGDFKVCVKNSESRFIKSLGLNYPDKKHAERAFFAGTITPMEFRDILLAFEKRTTPPWSTPLGGKIFIHAGGAHKDWTDGCIALYNSDMEELFRITDIGTPVSVRP
jgi:lipoprotein-anchoring transpeptidase ErfK/SrfK